MHESETERRQFGTRQVLPSGFVHGARELHPKVCETLGLPARSVAFQVLLDPIIAATEGALVACVHEAGGDLVEDPGVFDVYDGAQVEAGHKSMAVNVRMRAADHKLSADEVAGVRKAIIAAAESELGAVLR